MSINKKVLFYINGLGMGNSTRCFSIIEQLAERDIQVDIITSGNGLSFFRDKLGKQINQLIESKCIYYGKDKTGKLSIINTLKSLINFISIYIDNNRLINSYLENETPNAVILDSEYFFLPFTKRNIPIIALNNSDMVVSSFFKIKKKPYSIYPQFIFVEFLDFCFHLLIPNAVISPRINNFSKITKKFFPVGPIVRKNYTYSKHNPTIKYGVIMLSGSTFGSQVKLKEEVFPFHVDIIGRNGNNREGIIYHGKVLDNHTLINRADFLVINAGFSALSEAVYMKKPIVIIPVENHAEQTFNAMLIHQLGLGIISNSENISANINKLTSEIHKYQRNYSKVDIPMDGTIKALNIILSHI